MVRLKNKIALVLISTLATQLAYANILVTGPVGTTSSTTTSNFKITDVRLHTQSGMLVMTTTNNTTAGTGNSNNSIMLLYRPTTTDVSPTATGIAADTTLRNSCIKNVTIVPDPAAPENANSVRIISTISNTTRPTTAYLITPTAGVAVTKVPNDCQDVPAATSNLCGLTAGNIDTNSFVFAAVKKNGTSGADFASSVTGDGIRILQINNSTLAMTPVSVAGSPLDVNSTGSLSVGGRTGSHATTSIAAGTRIPMAFDEDLNVLYVGIPSITTDNTSSNRARTGAYSIGMFSVTSQGDAAQLSPCGGNNVVTPLVGGGQYIIAQRGANKTLTASNIKVMTTSTGPSADVRFKYLIVNGGNGAATATSNQIWAIPLVVGNENTSINGTFAKVTTGNFGTSASAVGDLYTTATAAAKVGNGPLPIPASSAISDMFVSGDAVYVSISAAAVSTAGSNGAAAITPGLYVSQAMFDELGKIAYWTEWHKIAPNALGNAESTSTGSRVGPFSVDGVTGHITAVDGNAGTTVRMTQWLNASTNQDGTPNAKGLVTNLNKTANVGDGCTAVCDLNSTTTAWGDQTPARMALFGGVNGKVCFAMTGSGISTYAGNHAALVTTPTGLEMIFDTSSNTTSLDYTSSTTLLLTQLPTGAGTVRSLAHSGWYAVSGATTPGFFFAGAETGNGNGALYAFCAASLGVGYNQRSITNLAMAPFRASSWQQLDRCDGIPVKILSQGGAVYILTRKVDSTGASMDRIFRLIKKQTGATLNTSFVVTATTGAVNGAVDLSAVNHIYDFVISQTGAGLEQLTMVTNDGVYTTTSSAGCDAAGYNNAPASAMLNCGWEKVTDPATMEGFMVKFFQPSHTRNPQSFISSQWAQSETNDAVYDKVQLVQYGRATNRRSQFGQDQMINFDAYDGTTTVPAGFVELPVISNLYSDGIRRFLALVTRTTSSHAMNLIGSPYRVDVWNLSAPYVIQDSVLQSLGAVYWMQPIAGSMMMGTSKGVVALQ